MSEITKSIKLLEEAADIRIAIKGMYDQYKSLTNYMQTLVDGVKHKDIKTAVDAIHYFGGVGYPHPNSPGRMEELLDKMVGMYRVLDFIGRGDMVHKHLHNYGITLQQDPKFKLQDEKLSRADLEAARTVCSAMGLTLPRDTKMVSDVYRFAIDTLNGVQTSICQNSNRIRKEIKPEVVKETGMEKAEVKRSLEAVKARKVEKLNLATRRRKRSTGSYKTFLEISKTVEGVRRPEYHDDD